MRYRPDYPRRDQVPEVPSSIREIMSDPTFELGVADVRAGRSRRPAYDLWPEINDQWAYERGRMWALLTPRDVQLKRDGKITNEAISWYARHEIEII